MNKWPLLMLESIQWKLQKFFSRAVGLLCECQWRWVSRPLIQGFCYIYQINLNDCKRTQLSDYHSLNDLFTRELRSETRPCVKSSQVILSPVDGWVSQLGIIQGEVLVQAKGKTYTLYDLLAGDQASVDLFKNGYFGNFYLAPSDYHRVHMPMAGTVVHTTYIPGFLFSVGSRNTQRIKQLFTRNERIVTLFDTTLGPFMIIQVASYFVGHMGTVWESKNTTPHRTQHISRMDYPSKKYHIPQAEEMGYFKLGSTVIVLFAQGSMQWEETLHIGKQLRYGECIGKTLPRGLEPLFTP